MFLTVIQILSGCCFSYLDTKLSSLCIATCDSVVVKVINNTKQKYKHVMFFLQFHHSRNFQFPIIHVVYVSHFLAICNITFSVINNGCQNDKESADTSYFNSVDKDSSNDRKAKVEFSPHYKSFRYGRVQMITVVYHCIGIECVLTDKQCLTYSFWF